MNTYYPSKATMKFSACVLTAGLLLATAAAVPSSDMSPLVKTSSVLNNNILSKTSKCPNLAVTPIGKIHSLTISNCTKGTYPCHVTVDESYIAATEFTCGAAHTRCRLVATMDVMGSKITIFTVPNDPNETIPVECAASQKVTPVFPFTVPSESIPGTYNVEITLYCDDYYGQVQLIEYCRRLTAVVDAAAC